MSPNHSQVRCALTGCGLTSTVMRQMATPPEPDDLDLLSAIWILASNDETL